MSGLKISSLTVLVLKAALGALGLTKGGKKAELQARLAAKQAELLWQSAEIQSAAGIKLIIAMFNQL